MFCVPGLGLGFVVCLRRFFNPFSFVVVPKVTDISKLVSFGSKWQWLFTHPSYSVKTSAF